MKFSVVLEPLQIVWRLSHQTKIIAIQAMVALLATQRLLAVQQQIQNWECKMNCNKITKPIFTKEQLEECYQCKHASGKKTWCCLLGVHLIEQGKVLTPNRDIKYPSLTTQAKGFAKGVGRHVASGMKTRTKAEQAAVMEICEVCEFYNPASRIGKRCIKCGCCLSLKKRWATAHCPINKW